MKYLATVVVLLVVLVGLARSTEADEQKERFIALYRTATTYTVSTSTVSAFYSCASTSSSVACSGRRRRKRKAGVMKDAIDSESMAVHQLTGSMGESDAPSAAEGRLGFTVWTTSTSTITMTTTSFNSATTVSLIYLCTAASGVSTVPACG